MDLAADVLEQRAVVRLERSLPFVAQFFHLLLDGGLVDAGNFFVLARRNPERFAQRQQVPCSAVSSPEPLPDFRHFGDLAQILNFSFSSKVVTPSVRHLQTCVSL
jgi:hypothetical protein